MQEDDFELSTIRQELSSFSYNSIEKLVLAIADYETVVLSVVNRPVLTQNKLNYLGELKQLIKLVSKAPQGTKRDFGVLLSKLGLQKPSDAYEVDEAFSYQMLSKLFSLFYFDEESFDYLSEELKHLDKYLVRFSLDFFVEEFCDVINLSPAQDRELRAIVQGKSLPVTGINQKLLTIIENLENFFNELREKYPIAENKVV